MPRQPYDFLFYNGTLDSKGDLLYQNNDYSTFTPDGYGGYPALLDFEAQFILQGINEGDTINRLNLNYSYRTDINQLINISIYNFTANRWHLIDSSVHTSFFNGGFSINHHDYYDSNFIICVRVEGFNSTSDFQLFLDQFKIEYKYTSYFFKSNYWWFFDVVEDDYVIFDSTEEYLGTYSFENDIIGARGTDVSIIDYYVPCPTNPPGGGTAYSKVIVGLDGHNTILKSYDDSTYAGGYGFQASHIFPTNIEYGTVELWVYKKDTGSSYDAGCPLVFRNSANETLFAFNMDDCHSIYGDDGLVRFTHNNGDTTWSGLYADDTWFHIRIDFETRETGNYLGLTQYTLNFWFEGVKKLDGVGFYENGTLNNLYWHSGGSSHKADYYFDSIAFSWDDNYEVGQNEDPNILLNELFDLELTNMDSIKYELFTCAELSYSFKTNITQQITLNLYNYLSQSWVEIDANVTNNSAFYSSTYWFISKDFINSEYKCRVNISGYNVNDFELHLQELKLKYTWGGVTCDLGQYDLIHDLMPNLNMTSEYSTIFQGDFVFEAEGLYLITITADDGYTISKNGTVIEIKNLEPYAHIGNFPNQTFEDSKVYLSSEVQVFGTNLTQSDLRYFWAFGDGLYNFEANPVHAWSEAGIYNISLTIVDCYANTYTDIRNITVLERAPEIKGPFTFYGVEGQAVTLDVDIFDAFLDELNLEYKWYDSSELVSIDKKPSLILQDGMYEYTLNVTDKLGYTATADISIIVEDAPPMVITSNYRYSGVSVSGTEGFFTGTVDDPGELELIVYGYDVSSDNNDLDYYWSITNDNTTFETYDLNSGLSSIAKFRVKETAVYLGQVKIVSANKSAVASFIINSFIDSNGNGISDEFEAKLLATGENISSFSDSDNDGLTDLYELCYSNTNYSDPDSDDDGLWDGLNQETGIGEQSFSTKPNDPDCDDDGLTDGMEFFGWNVTTDIFGTITATSDPWKNDTDGDGLSDYEEYCYGTNPRTSDTDTDGIVDSSDPYPTKYDYDGDGLSDKFELELGTALNASDTDNDGISDAEEILGWFKTNPLSADSDHDFASDSAEIQNYQVAIDDRYDLNDPVSISFEINCERAVSAQIAFMITFGEAINEPENEKVYGIQDVPDLNVSLVKVDDNLLLFNASTNSTRYYSKVIDIKEIMESNGKDYRGEYRIQINNTEAGCILEQFEIEIAGYLNPNDADFDNDGIMDGVEMGLLVRGTDTIDHSDLYGENTTVSFPMEETCWWTLDEGIGITARDLTFYENDGTLTNMESSDWKTGKIGDHALQFDGVNEYIDCGNEYFLDFERNDTFTLSAWIKTSSTGKAILSKMNVSGNYKGYDIYIHSTGVIRAHLINELDSNEIIVDGSTAINDNLWHFIVLTYNGSSSASGVKLYVDGFLENLTIVEDTLNATIHTNVDFLVGARTSGNFFSGQIDDVRVYSFEFTQDNVTWLYNNGNGRPSKTLDGEDIAEMSTQYNLEIPYVGIVYDANLTLAIESEGIPIGAGNITIEIVKEEINCSINNVILSSVFNEFSDTSQFSYEKFIDITPYVNNNSITEYYGKYLLNIEIHGTDYRDKFVIIEFYLQTETYVEARLTDTEGWITNPALKDTDGDGWDDYEEIFIEGTNPISADTDGDGVWDKYDRDPFQDVMLEISPISGAAPGQYKLKIVTIFTVEGTGEDYYIPTTKLEAHIYEYSLWTAYFDGTHGSSTELHYYANINDDTRVQSNTLEFILQLWRVDRYVNILGVKVKKWDKKLVGATDIYHINQVGYSEILTATKYDDQMNKVYEAKVNVSTIGVEKANTLAIYETNGTAFNGHYQEQERMNILQLFVNDNGAGTPFVEGPNVIVIPTSLFTETVFNAYVQNETLSETPIYSADDEIFMFISVGRDGNTKQACEEIDFVFIRFDISSEDAMEVLTLLLTCLVNETTNETAIVYSYVSTKLNDTTAVMMNLPFLVLCFIPWFCNFTESPIGSKPETFEDWFLKPWKTLGKAIVGVIIFIGMGIVAFVDLIKDFVKDILMEWLPILEYVLWLIIRAIIYILSWIILALTLIEMVIMWTVLLINFILMNSVFPGRINLYFFGFELSSEESGDSMKYEESIQWRYIKFFDLNLPVICKEIWQNGTLISWEESHIILMKTDLSPRNNSLIEEEGPSQSSLSTSSKIMLIEGTEQSNSLDPCTSGNTLPRSSSSEEISDDFKKILNGRIAAGGSLAMIIGGIVLPLYGLRSVIGTLKLVDHLSLAIFIISVVNLIVSTLLLTRNIIDQTNRPEDDLQQELIYNAYLYGFILGCIITNLIFVIAAAIGGGVEYMLEKPYKKAINFCKKVGGIGFGFLALTIKIAELGFKAFSNLLGANIVWVVLSLLLGAGIFTTINMIANKDTNTAKWVGWTGMAFGLIALLCSLLYKTMVPQENRNIISTI